MSPIESQETSHQRRHPRLVYRTRLGPEGRLQQVLLPMSQGLSALWSRLWLFA
jgi:hypothetical protein